MTKTLHELAKEMLNKANVEVLTETGKLKVETPKEVVKGETVKEDEINELSRKTLGSYIKKSSDDIGFHARRSVAADLNNMKSLKKHSDKKVKDRLSGIKAATKKIKKKSMFENEEITEDELDESTRKHFQQVADVIKSHPDAAKRKELAAHHSEIFAKQNPRFDKKKFHAASNAELDEGVNGEHGPDDDEDQLDRIERKKQKEPPFEPDKKKSTNWTSAKSKAKHLARAAMKAQVEKKK